MLLLCERPAASSSPASCDHFPSLPALSHRKRHGPITEAPAKRKKSGRGDRSGGLRRLTTSWAFTSRPTAAIVDASVAEQLKNARHSWLRSVARETSTIQQETFQYFTTSKIIYFYII